MQEVVLFLISFIFIFVIYEIFIVSRVKRNKKKNRNNDKFPLEVKYLVTKYKFDLKKVNCDRLLHVCALVSSFDMSLIVTLSMLFDSYFLQLLVVLVLVIPVILMSYYIVYLVYKKKGLI